MTALFVGCETQWSCDDMVLSSDHLTCATGTAIYNVDFPRLGACNSDTSGWRDCDNQENIDSCRSACENDAADGDGCCTYRSHLASGSNGIDSSTGKYGCLYYVGSTATTGAGASDIYAGMCTPAPT
eukprot:CAMPEP_0202702856 /NCGR_PEP_ID=MMETSP1385-20130828/15786_1 /ASSEMBLY_ACC=CAM_ASM_000861 /TAXON_ID=933848 /ORGANISM="Elphidium margaritaceum" /LENGTH=126 /DNA_ID=CAMNT_0049360593 /DNA_START=8 /DNA_END=384 /DNA_ORIENTATION=+